MLSIYDEIGYKPVVNRKNFNIVYDYEGEQELSFDLNSNDEIINYIQEESSVKYKDNKYLVKRINKRKILTTINCQIDMDAWKERIWMKYDKTYALFSEVVLDIIPNGWVIEGVGSVTSRKATHMQGATSYDILMNCKKLYNITFEYHTGTRTIKVMKPDVVQSRGLYITDELNLQGLEFKGESSSLVTRLYAYGKKTEERDEEGNISSVSYVNFASINNGKEYVDNNEFTNKIIATYWQDDRYTDAQSLLNDAIDKLKLLSVATRSYSCKLIDYSRINEKYKHLDFKLYDKVTLMDSINNTCVQHQIVQYKEYPDNENLNEVVLSSVFKSIVGTIDGIKQSVSTIDTEIKRTETSINEIIRDVESNTSRIKNTYTKGETDVQIESVVQQTADEINLSIQKIEEKIDNIDTTLYHAEISNDGTSITKDTSIITLTAKLMNASSEVLTSAGSFNWKRVSNNTSSDTIWNDLHKGRKSVVITSDDLDKSANFYCEVTAPEWKGKTSSITINDETKIPQLSSSFIDVTGVQLVQTLNTDGTYSPSWEQMKPVITPSVIDGVLDVPLTKCKITYKRVANGVESPLIGGETVTNGILIISKNVMSKALTSITYIAYITYKEVSIKLFASFSLNVLGKDGIDGIDGVDGLNGKDGSQGIGIKSVLDEFYVSTSKSDPVGGSWSSAKPIWSTGKYLWKRTKNTKTDDTVTYTTAYCDNSWEAVNELEIGGRNLALDTSKENLKNRSCHYNVAHVEYEKTDYTVSFFAKGVTPGNATVYINDDTGQARIYVSFGLISLTTEYQKFVLTKKSTYNYAGEVNYIYIRIYGSTANDFVSCKNLKLERGSKATDWTPAPEDIKQDLADTEVRITESYNSAIEETNKNIRLFVAESIEATGDWQSALNSLRNEVVLTKDATEFLKTSSQVIKDLQTGKVDINEIKEWARFDGATLELGASNSQYKTKLTTTELGFYQGNTKVAWISNNELHVTSISAEKSIKTGTFIFEDEGAYGFTLKKVGG